MNRYTKGIAAISSAILITAQLFSASVCYAEDFDLNDYRDDTLFLEAPESWQEEEIGSIDEDVENIEEGECVYEILALYDAKDNKQAELWAYADPDDYGDYYCNSEEDTEEYYENSGRDALELILGEALPGAELDEDSIEYVKGEEYYTFAIRQNAEQDGKSYLVYLNCEYASEGGLHLAMVFEQTQNREICDRIASSVEGYSYADELLGDDTDYAGDNDTYYGDAGDPSFADILLSAGLVLLLAFGVSVLKRYRDGGRFSSSKTKTEMPKSVKPKAVKADPWVRKEMPAKKLSPQIRHRAQEGQVRVGAKYSGYYESLKTLHKSGLLTTKEMNELMEKHKDDIEIRG